MSWQQRIDRALDERRAAEAFRRRLPVTHGAGRWLEREGERWLNFSSNDYLGLSQHPAIIAAWQQGATRYGVGAGGSGHVSGYSEAHRALEEALVDWLGYP
ncbi:aminotransferase class I/II-fold pyridoxal phosphate-dependent enzyme, partial [Klebsiella pneumoniae]|nr:aminotransferase class I/II-fold pyridoxal phosphate-dependent enzyme [Klebsiella pneumoniae]